MTHDEEKSFAISISRELGSISARLSNIEHLLEDHSRSFAPIFERIEFNKNQITELKVKVFFISSGISFVVSVLPYIAGYFLKTL